MRIRWDNIVLSQVFQKQSLRWGLPGQWFSRKCSQEKQVRRWGKQDCRRKEAHQVQVQVQAEPMGVPSTWTHWETLEQKLSLSCPNPRQGLGQARALIPTSYLSGTGKKCTICFRSPGGRVYVTQCVEAWRIFCTDGPAQKLHVQCLRESLEAASQEIQSIFSSSLLVRLWVRNRDEVDIKIMNKKQFRGNELNSSWTFGDFLAE